MAIDIELLTKLVKLANNNPNENEANAAARKACKIIEEGKFEFGRVGRSSIVFDFDFSNIRTERKRADPRKYPSYANKEKEAEEKRKEEWEKKNREAQQPKTIYEIVKQRKQATEDLFVRSHNTNRTEKIIRICSVCEYEISTFNESVVYVCFNCMVEGGI